MTDQIMDFLNSPLLFASIFGLVLVIWITAKLLRRNRCKYCRKGVIQEVSAEPKRVNHSDYSGRAHLADFTSTAKVETRVKYQCSHCGEFYHTTENR